MIGLLGSYKQKKTVACVERNNINHVMIFHPDSHSDNIVDISVDHIIQASGPRPGPVRELSWPGPGSQARPARAWPGTPPHPSPEP